MKNTIYLNYFLSFLVYFTALSICTAIVSWLLSGGETFKYGVPLLRAVIAGYFTYKHRLRFIAEW